MAETTPGARWRVSAHTLRPQPFGFRYLLRPLAPGEDPAEAARASLPDEEAARAVAGRSIGFADFSERNRTAHLARDATVVATPPQSSRYSAAGDAGLVDGVRGSIDRRGGHWQGYRGSDVWIDIPLGVDPAAVSEVRVGLLQHPGSGVYLPFRIVAAASGDGETLARAGAPGYAAVEIEPASRGVSPPDPAGAEPPAGGRRTVTLRFDEPVPALGIEVRIEGLERIPEGWPEGGQLPWIYLDEIIVR